MIIGYAVGRQNGSSNSRAAGVEQGVFD